MNNNYTNKEILEFPTKDIIEVLKDAADNNEDIVHLREIKESENIDPIKDLKEATQEFAVDKNGKPVYTINSSATLNESDKDLMEAINGGIDKENDKTFKDAFTENATNTYGLSDEDAIKMLDLITTYKKDPSINVYKMMPSSIQNIVNQICTANGIPISHRNSIAKELITQFISEASQDQAFIDFEKALDAAMRIPSLTDLYNEHLNETMDKRLPAMAEAIKETDPDKAAMLFKIADRFTASMTYSDLKEKYDTVGRIRKTVRRDYKKFNNFAMNLNYFNRDTSFKMSDACLLYDILYNILVSPDTSDITETDIMKFITLLCISVEGYNMYDTVDASYVYYLLKNIIMLSYSNDRAKSSFSAELISNIKVLIYYIRAKENEFNEEYNNSSNHRQKRSKRNSSRK